MMVMTGSASSPGPQIAFSVTRSRLVQPLAVMVADVEFEQERVAVEPGGRAPEHPEDVPQPPPFVLALHAPGDFHVLAPDRRCHGHRELDSRLPRHLAHVHQHAVLDGLRPRVGGNDFRIVPKSLAGFFAHCLSPFSMN